MGAQALGVQASVLAARGLSTGGTWARCWRHVGSVLAARGLGTGGTWAQLLHSMRDLPKSVVESMHAALTGRFSTSGLQGSPRLIT